MNKKTKMVQLPKRKYMSLSANVTEEQYIWVQKFKQEGGNYSKLIRDYIDKIMKE